MVQIIQAPKPKQTFASQFGAGLGAGLGKGIPEAIESYSDKLKLQRENAALKERYGLDLKGIESPQTRQTLLAHELQFGKKMKQAEASLKPYEQKATPLEQGMEARSIPSTEKQPSRQVSGKNFPQEETTGQKIPLMTPQEIESKGVEYARVRNAQGLPTTAQEGIQFAEQQNARNAEHNARVDADNLKRLEAQKRYGEQSVEKLTRLMPNATDEQQSLFRRKGENAAAEGMSEGDIDRTMSKEAAKFKNTIANLEKTIEPSRLFSGIKKKLLGTEREKEKEYSSIRNQLKPLLDEGLYDTARSILSEKGYYPEERESIISTLGEGPRKTLAEMPSLPVKKSVIPGVPAEQEPLTEKQAEMFQNNLFQALKSDPAANLILLRKAYEDKNINWSDFRDALDLGLAQGAFELNPEQYNQLTVLNSPPLNKLEKHLYDLGLIGR